MKAALSLHPVLFALFPVLSLYTTNFHEVDATDVLPAAGACLLLAASIYFLALLATRSLSRAATATSLSLVWFWFFAPVLRALDGLGFVVDSGLWIAVFAGWSAVLGLAVIGLVRRRDPRPIATILNVSGLALLVSTAVPLLSSPEDDPASRPAVTRAHTPASSGGAGSTASEQREAAADGELPDVYLIVLDAYGRRDQLKEHFGYEDELSAGLERRGFYVASRSNANYNGTGRSLPSLLNYRFLDGQNFLVSARSVCVSSIRSELAARGYRFTSCASGFRMSQCEDADRYVEHGDWALLAAFSNFEQVLINGTPLEFWLRTSPAASPYAIHRRRILACFQALPTLAGNGQADLVLAHVVSPHGPFVFGRNGEDISPYDVQYSVNHIFQDPDQPEEAGGVGPEYARLYREQAGFIGERVLEVVDEILSESKAPPVVVVMGDHGPRGFTPDLREAQYEILNAYYLPGEGKARELYPEISPVNSLRVILNAYFGGEYELLPDHRYRKQNRSWSRIEPKVD